jgi:hypothetical protein
MKFTYSFRRPELNFERFKKELDTHMKEMLASGLVAWLNVVTAEVPVWSGASRATFLKIAGEIGFPVDVSGGNAPEDRTGIGQAASKGKLVADITTGEYTFLYSTSLPWLIWNEYHNANIDPDPTLFYKLKKPGPYEFQAKGAAAFIHETRQIGLPKVAPFIQSVSVRR